MVNRPVPAGALLRPGKLGAPTVSGTVPTPTCMEAKERLRTPEEDLAWSTRPLLMVDIDGVISLFGAWPRGGWQPADERAGRREVEGRLHAIDGIPHFLSSTAAAHLLALASWFDLVWASGWEERANEHLPHLLGLPSGLPFLRFERSVGRSNAHWKLAAIEAYAGRRALAWVDDAFNEACWEWALGRSRTVPTLLVATDPARGLTERETGRLEDWARALGEPAALERG